MAMLLAMMLGMTAALLPAARAPGAGLVETMDGRTLRGEVQPAGAAALAVAGPRGPAVTVQLEHVLRASIRTAAGESVWAEPEFRLSPVTVTVESGIRLNQSATDALNGLVGRTPRGDPRRNLTDARSPASPADDHTWFGGIVTWDLGPDPPPERRQLDSVTVWIRADDKSRKDFAGALAVSIDGEHFVEIPGTRREVNFGRTGRQGTFNRITWTFERGRVTGFRHLRLIADTPVTGADPRIIEVDAFVSSIDPRQPGAGMVILRGGSRIVGAVGFADATSTVITRADGARISVPTTEVARILFRRFGEDLPGLLPPGRRGVITSDGDFLEGELRGIQDGQVRVSSLLFGMRSLGAGYGAIAVSLRDIAAARSRFVVRCVDGSLLLADDLGIERRDLLVTLPGEGRLRVRWDDLVELAAGESRLRFLADMRATAAEGEPAPATRPAAFSAAAAARISGREYRRCVVARPGTRLVWQIDGQYAALVCRVGVAQGALPTAALTFVVIGDGRELCRSQPRTSADEPQLLSANVAGVRRLELLAAGGAEAMLAGQAVWAEAALAR